MLRQIIRFGAVLVLGASGAHAATTMFVVNGHDADNPATTIIGGANGGTSTVTAEGGAQYTISFAAQPSPSIVLSATAGTSYTSYRADYIYTVGVSFSAPLSYTVCRKDESCATPPMPIGFATGRLTVDGSGTAGASAGAQRFDGDGVGDGCDGPCHLDEPYQAELFIDRTATGGFTGATGPENQFTFYIPLDLILMGHLPGDGVSQTTLSVDPVVSLNPAFFAANGIDPTTARLTFEPGIGNAVSGAPEPATWALLLAGFAGTGAVLRRTRRGTVLSLAA